MLGARNQTPSPLGSFLHADLILAISITTLGLGTIALMRTAAADPEGRGWHDKLSGMALLHARRTNRPGRDNAGRGVPHDLLPQRPGRHTAQSPSPLPSAPGPTQVPWHRRSPRRPPLRTSVRPGTPPGARLSPPPSSAAPRARNPPRNRPLRPPRSQASPPPALGPPSEPCARPRRRRARRHGAGSPGNAAPVRARRAPGPTGRRHRRPSRPPLRAPRAPPRPASPTPPAGTRTRRRRIRSPPRSVGPVRPDPRAMPVAP